MAVLLFAAPGFSQTKSNNLLLNPGSEQKELFWNKLESDNDFEEYYKSDLPHTGIYKFNLWGGYEQIVDISTFANYVDPGYAEVSFSGWMYVNSKLGNGATDGVFFRFLNDQQVEKNGWIHSQITFPRKDIWEKFTLSNVKIPTETRFISVILLGEYNHINYLDDLSLQIITTEPLNQTPTPTPINNVTPTIQIFPTASYNFSDASASENKLLLTPPGTPGEFDLADVFFRPLTTATGDEAYTDGFGAAITLDGGEGATFFGNPIKVEEDYLFMRMSAWASDMGASLALGALDAKEAQDLAGAGLNGAIGVNILMDTARFKNKFGYIEALYKAERGAVVPVFQVANGAGGKRVTIQFDNLEIYRIPKAAFPILKSGLNSPGGKRFLRIGEKTWFGE